MNQPWGFIGFGTLFLVFGGFLTWMGFAYDNGTRYVMLAGWIVDGLGFAALFTGLVALAVEVGIRAARR